MSAWVITFIDGTETSGLAIGTPDEVFAYMSVDQAGISRLVVSAADDGWPEPSESPTHY
jgi:hypothetical protein